MKTAPRGAFAWFDALRFVAALVVVIEHARDLVMASYAEAGPLGLAWKAFYALTIFGHPAVVVFFVLSGFWISKTVERRIDGGRFWADYLADRLTRLLIVLAPALAIGALCDWGGGTVIGGPVYAGTSGSLTIAFPVAERLGIVPFLGNLAFVQTLLVKPFGSNGALWSLANEFWYYLAYPPLVLLATRRRLSAGLAAVLVLLAFPHLLTGFGVWLMGSALFHFDRRWIARPSRRVALAWLAGALGLLALALGAARVGRLPEGLSDLVVGAAFALTCMGLLLVDPAPPRWLKAVSRYGAEASYSLYVTHLPLLVLLAAMALRGVPRLQPGAGSLGLFAGIVALVVGWAWLFSSLTERRTHLLRDRIKARLGLSAPSRPAAAAS